MLLEAQHLFDRPNEHQRVVIDDFTVIIIV